MTITTKYDGVTSDVLSEIRSVATEVKTILKDTGHSVASLRDVMRTFSEYVWLQNEGVHEPALHISTTAPTTGATPKLADARITASAPIAAMVHMLNGRQRFSEEEAQFPNVFLSREFVIDRKELSKEEAPDSAALESVADSTAKTPAYSHPNYWLNIRLLSYLSARSDGVSRNEIVGFFCGPGSRVENDFRDRPKRARGVGVYEEFSIVSALQRYQEAGGPRVLEIAKSSTSPTNNELLVLDRLRLTKRGSTLINSIWRRLYYLQLCIDDGDLPLPVELTSHRFEAREEDDEPRLDQVETYQPDRNVDFAYIKDHDYRYLFDSPDKYREVVVRILSHKARKVARFLGILSAAQEAEDAKYWLVMQRLNT